MPSTTPFLDLEDRLFARDCEAIDRNALRYVLGVSAVSGRRRHVTDRYRIVMPQRPALDVTHAA